MTHYPKFFLHKGRILALRVMYKPKNELMKRCHKIWAGAPPPLLKTKSKKTAPFLREPLPHITTYFTASSALPFVLG